MPGSPKKRRRVRDRTDFAQTRRGTQGGVDARQAQERGTAALHFLPAFRVQEPPAALAIRAVTSVLPFPLATSLQQGHRIWKEAAPVARMSQRSRERAAAGDIRGAVPHIAALMRATGISLRWRRVRKSGRFRHMRWCCPCRGEPARITPGAGSFPREGREKPAHSCNWRFNSSTSSDSAASLPTKASILRTACSTVVWSRPPKRRPISGNERSVSVLARYIAT
jgi:hypothetical protein